MLLEIQTTIANLAQRLPVPYTYLQQIEMYVPPIRTDVPKGRVYTTTGHAVGRYLEKVFRENELAHYNRQQPVTNGHIQRAFLRYFKNRPNIIRRFAKGKQTIGMYRKAYNEQKLYAAQEPVYMISLEYDLSGIPMVGGAKRYSYLTFEAAYQRCLEFKVADPRFFTPETIRKVRSQINSENAEWYDWRAPSEDTLKQITTEIKVAPYNSMYFPQGYGKDGK